MAVISTGREGEILFPPVPVLNNFFEKDKRHMREEKKHQTTNPDAGFSTPQCGCARRPLVGGGTLDPGARGRNRGRGVDPSKQRGFPPRGAARIPDRGSQLRGRGSGEAHETSRLRVASVSVPCAGQMKRQGQSAE